MKQKHLEMYLFFAMKKIYQGYSTSILQGFTRSHQVYRILKPFQ